MFFVLRSDNGIEAHDIATTVPTDAEAVFIHQHEFLELVGTLAIGRLVEIWNGFAGAPPLSDLRPVKKFENKNKAARRIWAALQRLAGEPLEVQPAAHQDDATASVTAPSTLAALAAPKRAKKPAKAAKAPKAATGTAKRAKTPRKPKAAAEEKQTAKATVLAMIQRKGGATLDEICSETGWQKHTVRGFMSVQPAKAGLDVTSSKREDGARVYEAK